MSAGEVLGRGMAFPPRVGADGRIAWSEGEANIREAVRIVLLCTPGERLRRPTFGAGIERSLFDPNTTSTRREIEGRIRRALADWEPRIALEGVEVVADEDNESTAIATITFRIIATQAVERVTAAVTLNG